MVAMCQGNGSAQALIVEEHPAHLDHLGHPGVPGRSPPRSGICSYPPACASQAPHRRNAPLDNEQTRRTATNVPHRLQGRNGG